MSLPLPESPGLVAPFRMGDWIVLPARNCLAPLSDPTAEVQVEPRIMHVLLCLVARPGEVLTRQELLAVVWRGVIVKEEALTHAISQLAASTSSRPSPLKSPVSMPKAT